MVIKVEWKDSKTEYIDTQITCEDDYQGNREV